MLLLASASPRRRDLLTQAGYSFQVDSIPVDEERLPREAAEALAQRLAREKAEAVFSARAGVLDREDDPLVVLGADTVVECGAEILGKPEDDPDALRMLRMLAGRTHRVVTGVCVMTARGAAVAAESTTVTMLPVADEDLIAYIATGEPRDKAGAYAIQGRASRWIPRVEGCYFNVVGLPVARTSAMIDAAMHLAG